MKKTIFISVFQSFISRNILNTGVLNELLKEGNRVVLFVPSAKEKFYKETYQENNIFIESLDPGKYDSVKEKFFRNLAELLVDTKAMRFRKMKRNYLNGNTLIYFYQRIITIFLGHSKVIKKIFRYLEKKLNKEDIYEPFFKKYLPDVIFAPDVFGLGDVKLIKSAQLRGVKNIGMVASWDNNTTKGLMRVIPDALLVQNEIIKEESISIQSIPSGILKVVGIAHYDFYKEYKPINREDFFKKIGIDYKKRLIVFSPAGSKFISTDWQICEILKEAYKEGNIPLDVVTLIRVHPTNPVNLEQFTPTENFIIENPGVEFKGLGDKKKELDKDALYHLLDTLHYSELVINVVSSIVIDAAVLDKPIITIGFEGWEKNVPFATSVKRYHTDENMAKLLDIGGTKIVRNKTELIEAINAYLINPNIDKEGRAKIVEKQCYKLDGKAKLRIRNVILGNQ